ncbi:MAG TPA: hypothetical protein VFX51_27285 [Solirubrobacteraceae bacterium]|nr:hypothetical protein [Solirubrobacteraceae bacterium]
MIVFALTQQAPPILVLALLILCYLTVLELRKEDVPFLLKAWWTLLVFLGHVVGFAVFWIWLSMRRRAAGPA